MIIIAVQEYAYLMPFSNVAESVVHLHGREDGLDVIQQNGHGLRAQEMDVNETSPTTILWGNEINIKVIWYIVYK